MKITQLSRKNLPLAPMTWVFISFTKKNGSVKELQLFDGIPSDANFLNEELDQTNELFGQLLEIQQKS